MENTIIIRPWQFLLMYKTYVDKVNAGINVIVSGRNTTYKVEKTKDPYKMTKEEFFAKIDRAEQQYREGKYTTCRTPEETKAWLDSL